MSLQLFLGLLGSHSSFTLLLLNTSVSLSGGRLISLNHVSLEGVTFSEAAEVMKNSPEEVQLIISQPKGAVHVGVWLLCVQ